MLTPLKARKKTVSLLLVLILMLTLSGLTAQGRQNITFLEEALLTVVAPVQGDRKSVV